MTTWVALLRGINVGKAKRIAMADLRALCESLGYRNVRTVLNSGNVLFETNARKPETLAKNLEAALVGSAGFHANTVVLSMEAMRAIQAGNPLGTPPDPSRFLVAFPYGTGALDVLTPLLASNWQPDAIATTSAAAYLHARSGILQSPLMLAFQRATGDRFTTRNWATLEKMVANAT